MNGSTTIATPTDPHAPAPPGPDAAKAPRFASTRGEFWLWVGAGGGAIIWSLQMTIGYALCRFSSDHRWLTFVHHAVSAIALAATIGTTFVSWRNWQQLGDGQPRGSEPGVPGRSRFLAALGVISGVYFIAVILAQWIPVFFIDPNWF
jgi:hypothetical protein